MPQWHCRIRVTTFSKEVQVALSWHFKGNTGNYGVWASPDTRKYILWSTTLFQNHERESGYIRERSGAFRFRIVQGNFRTQKLYDAFFNAAGNRAATFFRLVKDVLYCFHMTIDNCHEHQHSGLQALTQQENPRAHYTYAVWCTSLTWCSRTMEMCRYFLGMMI